MNPCTRPEPARGRPYKKTWLALTLVVLLTPAAPAQAGFMEGVSNFFGKAVDSVKGLFGGGKASGDAGSEFDTFLGQVESSQEALFTAQSDVINYYNENSDKVGLDDAKAQELLNVVSDASRTNEDAYLQLLQVRASLLEKEQDVSAYDERLATIQENQKRLEEGFQDIQNFNKDAGLYTPPPGGDALASADTGDGSGDLDPNDPEVAGLIDEWLAANGLDEYGRETGAGNGVVIRASQGADTNGRTRHQYVWEEYLASRGKIGKSLEDYVRDRLGGAPPAAPAATDAVAAVPEQSPQSTDLTSTQPAGAEVVGGDTGDEPAAPSENTALASVTDDLNEAVKELQELQKQQKAQTPEGRALLERIRNLQKQRNELLSGS